MLRGTIRWNSLVNYTGTIKYLEQIFTIVPHIYLDGEIKIKDAVYNLLHYSFSATQSAKNLISIVS